MKKLTLLFLLCLPLAVFSQSYFKFKVINADNGKPWPKLWHNIIKDGYKAINTFTSTSSDSSGTYTFRLDNYDPTATYEVEIDNQSNAVRPGRYDISGLHKRVPVIYVRPGNEMASNPCG